MTEWYTLEEAFHLWEVVAVDRHNEWLAHKAAERAAKRSQQ